MMKQERLVLYTHGTVSGETNGSSGVTDAVGSWRSPRAYACVSDEQNTPQSVMVQFLAALLEIGTCNPIRCVDKPSWWQFALFGSLIRASSLSPTSTLIVARMIVSSIYMMPPFPQRSTYWAHEKHLEPSELPGTTTVSSSLWRSICTNII
jgi:hypothetical protein